MNSILDIGYILYVMVGEAEIVRGKVNAKTIGCQRVTSGA